MKLSFLCFILIIALGSAYFRLKHEGPIKARESFEHKTKNNIETVPVINAGMAELGEALRLTPNGEKTFFSTNPQYITNKNEMAQICTVGHSLGSVLGCYFKNQHQILILKINEPSLKSGVLSTAAHETLHAIYDKLPAHEKAELNAHLRIAMAQNEPYLKERMKSYQISHQDVMLDEVHSILGTEVTKLSNYLENHYQKYFKDRAYLIKQANIFKAQFDKRINRIHEYDGLIQANKEQIDEQKKILDNLQRQYTSRLEEADIAKNNSDYETYNSLVPEVNKFSNLLWENQKKANELIASYNDLIRLRNNYVRDSNEFAATIDTRPKESGSP